MVPHKAGRTTIDIHIETTIDHRGGSYIAKDKAATLTGTTCPWGGREEITIHPGQYILTISWEEFNFPPSICAFVIPRSVAQRSGLVVTTGYVDPGYHGRLTVSIHNPTDGICMIERGASVASLILSRCSEPSVYDGFWQGGVISKPME